MFISSKKQWLKNQPFEFVSVLEVAIGEYGISLDKLVAAAETIQVNQKSVALTTQLPEESKLSF